MKISLYPGEFFGMVEFLRFRLDATLRLSLYERTIYEQVLLEYWEKGNVSRKTLVWGHRSPRQRYQFTIPVSVMRILHQEMQHYTLSLSSQAFLARLDQALINQADWQDSVIRNQLGGR